MDADEKRTLRETIARALWEDAHPPQHEAAWSAIVAAPESSDMFFYARHYRARADVVLDALGLEQVGWRWYEPRPESGWYFAADYPLNTLSTPEPVYRLAASGWVTEGKGTQ